ERGPQQAGEDAQQRALAAAVRPGHRHRARPRELEVELGHAGGPVAVAMRELRRAHAHAGAAVDAHALLPRAGAGWLVATGGSSASCAARSGATRARACSRVPRSMTPAACGCPPPPRRAHTPSMFTRPVERRLTFTRPGSTSLNSATASTPSIARGRS